VRVMRKSLCSVFLLSIAGSLFAADTISGTWTGEWGPNSFERNRVVAELKYDGKVVTGTFNSGPSPATISKGTFNEKTGVIHLEADGRGRGGAKNHYVIDGKLENGKITGTWKYDKGNGDFTITRQ
jgi:hypothetical protein